MINSVWSHEASYKYKGIAGLIHRSRLHKITKLLEKSAINFHKGKLADFGCSNGYIISLLNENLFRDKQWKFYGFDFEEKLLVSARERNLENTEFYKFNLNIVNGDQWHDAFDIVTSFETLEHVGNYKNAFENIYNSCRKNGLIIISIPNEKGIPGSLKYLGRKLFRRNAYGDFFKSQNELKYCMRLVFNKPIDGFRTKSIDCWGEHLGFDWKSFEQFIDKRFIQNGKCRLLNKNSSFLYFNFIYSLEKLI